MRFCEVRYCNVTFGILNETVTFLDILEQFGQVFIYFAPLQFGSANLRFAYISLIIKYELFYYIIILFFILFFVSGNFSIDPVRVMYLERTKKHFAFPALQLPRQVTVMHRGLLPQLIF